jgi:hypothetical protein
VHVALNYRQCLTKGLAAESSVDQEQIVARISPLCGGQFQATVSLSGDRGGEVQKLRVPVEGHAGSLLIQQIWLDARALGDVIRWQARRFSNSETRFAQTASMVWTLATGHPRSTSAFSFRGA